MRTAQLADVCEVVMGQAPSGNSYNDERRGVPLVAGAGDMKAGRIVPTKYTTAPTKLSRPDDVIIGIRASIGMRAQASEEVCLGRGVAALRPGPELDRGYLWHWIEASASRLAAKGRGATFLQVSRRDIAEMEIPVPQLDEQRRLAATLDSVDTLRQERRRAGRLVESLASSLFVSLFGDPVSNPRGWPVTQLGSLGKLDRGVSRHRPRNAPELLGGQYPLIQTGDVARSAGLITTFARTYSEAGLRQSRLWPAGTLCITIAANIAMTGILAFDACFPDSVVGFTADAETTAYVQAWLGFLQPTLERSAPESAQKNINLAILRGLPVPTPPASQMSRFAKQMAAIRSIEGTQASSLTELDALFGSLQHRAFNGAL